MGLKTCVVGSGPAGVAAVRALTSAGHRVTLLDVGTELEPDRQAIVQQLGQRSVDEWPPEWLAVIKSGQWSPGSGARGKPAYGSDFPYRDAARLTPTTATGATAVSSLAKGGLSNVWGAAVLPYRSDDMEGWPFGADELAPAYEALFRFMPLAARRDRLEPLFPLYAEHVTPLRLSEQAERLLERLERNEPALRAGGFAFGASRLAVHQHGTGCVYCGLCMYGCPHGLIYNATHSLENVHYIGNFLVERVVEAGGSVTVFGRDVQSGSPAEFKADRVFLACGVFQTARIMMRSMEQAHPSLVLRDSQYFLVPVLGLRRATDAVAERLHTLAQLFIEVSEPAVGAHRAHLQVYTYNDLYLAAAQERLGRLYSVAGPTVERMLNRLMVIQGYLHSSVSSTASIALDDGKLSVTGNNRADSARRVRLLVRTLTRHASRLGFVPLTPLLEIGDTGHGSHVGGTMPMSAQPSGVESDRYGRPFGFARVHVVDASVFPSIPATTITLSVMANAYRIASVAYDS